MPKTKSIALILGVLVMSFLIGYLIFAWTEPSQAPPGGNVYAPINVGSTQQWKEGGLGVGVKTFDLSSGQIAASAYYDRDASSPYILDLGGTSILNSLSVGSASQFQVNSSGNLTKINNISYNWPSAQGAANTFLRNDGSGNLSWAAAAGGGAPTDASYIVVGLNGTLTAERALVAGNGLTSTDGGANGNFTLNVGAGTGISVGADSISVIYGSTAGTAAEGNKTITVSAGTGLTGGGTITIGAGGSTSLSLNTAGISTCTNATTNKIIWDSTNNRLNCATDQTGGGGGLPSGSAGDTLRYDGTNWVANNVIYNNGTNVGIGVGSSIDSNYKLTIGYTGVKITNTGSTYTLYAEDETSDTTPFVIDTSGNVGIGTTAPREKLQIGDRFTFHDGGAKVIGYNFYYGGSPVADRRILADEVANIVFTDTGDISFRTAGSGAADSIITWTQGLFQKNDGNVGIGTTSPQSRLHVKDGQTWGSDLRIDASGTTGGRNWLLISTGGTAGEGQGKFLIKDNDANAVRLAIDTSGNVGIGTTTPGARLTVRQDASGAPFLIRLQNLQAGNEADFTLKAGGDKFIIGDERDSAERFTIDTNGNVGIGTTSPGARLTVSLPNIAGSSGRDAIEITGGNTDSFRAILVNKPELRFWSTSDGNWANIYARNGMFEGNLNVNGGYYKGGTRGLPSEDLRPTIVFSTRSGGSCGGGGETLISGTITVNTASKIIVSVKMDASVHSPYGNYGWLERDTTSLPTTLINFPSGNYVDNSYTQYVDTVPAGTYTYKFIVQCEAGGQLSWTGINMILQAYSQ